MIDGLYLLQLGKKNGQRWDELVNKLAANI